MSTVSQLFMSPAVDAQWPGTGSRLHHSVGHWPLVINDSTSVAAVGAGR
ncbi:hypothetical protein QK290_04985 [Pseudarthrobacter sp. AL07]|nr:MULTISPECIES: hypothetical protein [unclassified Pseudarthrobacter]MDI3193607.1 hypothetical protein [Pseudarthrobacter sp. AL20]MDI3207883.1 hypothetical protein [Pseudarthrobacter sp. AL07]